MDNIEQQLANILDSDGNASNADMTALLTGGLAGDTTGKTVDTGAPSTNADDTNTEGTGSEDKDKGTQPDKAKTDPTEGDQPKDADPKPVLLAKDGVHTIDYQKLVDARAEAAANKEAARVAAEEAAALRQQLADAKKAPAAKPDDADPAATEDKPLFGDYTDSDLKKGVEAVLAAKLKDFSATIDAKFAPAEAARERQALMDHMTPIYEAHPDADSIVASQEFAEWKAAQPSFIRVGIDHALTQGTSAEVVDALSSYRTAHPVAKPTTAPAAAPAAAPATPKSVADRASEALAKVKDRTPTSLSDIPAGSQAHHDEAGAMAEMSSIELMNRFDGKTPAQIEALLQRTL